MNTGYLLHLIGGEAGYQRTLREQGGCCAICGKAPQADDKRSFHIDHDHRAGMVRGVLCGPCNTGLGMFAEDEDSLEQAILYLRHWREEHAAGRGHVPDYSGPRRREAVRQPSKLPKNWAPELIVPEKITETYLSALAKLNANGI